MNNKQKIGRYLDRVKQIGLLIFVASLLISLIKPMTKTVICIFSSLFLVELVRCIITGEVSLRGGGSFKRKNMPLGYWSMVFFYFMAIGAILLLAFKFY